MEKFKKDKKIIILTVSIIAILIVLAEIFIQIVAEDSVFAKAKEAKINYSQMQLNK